MSAKAWCTTTGRYNCSCKVARIAINTVVVSEIEVEAVVLHDRLQLQESAAQLKLFHLCSALVYLPLSSQSVILSLGQMADPLLVCALTPPS